MEYGVLNSIFWWVAQSVDCLLALRCGVSVWSLVLSIVVCNSPLLWMALMFIYLYTWCKYNHHPLSHSITAKINFLDFIWSCLFTREITFFLQNIKNQHLLSYNRALVTMWSNALAYGSQDLSVPRFKFHLCRSVCDEVR